MTCNGCSDWSNHWFHPLSRETKTIPTGFDFFTCSWQHCASAEQYVWAPPPMGRLYYFARPGRVPLRHDATPLVMQQTLITIAEIPCWQFNNVGWSEGKSSLDIMNNAVLGYLHRLFGANNTRAMAWKRCLQSRNFKVSQQETWKQTHCDCGFPDTICHNLCWNANSALIRLSPLASYHAGPQVIHSASSVRQTFLTRPACWQKLEIS